MNFGDGLCTQGCNISSSHHGIVKTLPQNFSYGLIFGIKRGKTETNKGSFLMFVNFKKCMKWGAGFPSLLKNLVGERIRKDEQLILDIVQKREKLVPLLPRQLFILLNR